MIPINSCRLPNWKLTIKKRPDEREDMYMNYDAANYEIKQLEWQDPYSAHMKIGDASRMEREPPGYFFSIIRFSNRKAVYNLFERKAGVIAPSNGTLDLITNIH